MQAPASNAPSLADAAHEAEARCGARVRELGTVQEISSAFELFNEIWGNDDWGAVPINVMRAMAHSRNYIAGAWDHDRLVAASVAFAWGDLSVRALHSHISGVREDSQGRGIGLALKLHQRAWAAEHGYDRITWTFDPLVQRNAWFNLTKLGARVVEYRPDFYGPMNDSINAGDPTDRCVALWDVTPPPPGDAAGGIEPGEVAAPVAALLVRGDGDVPLVTGDSWERAATLSCQLPRDIVELRRRQPDLALRWRVALRDTMGAAIDAGFVASAMTRDGRYVLERSPA